MIELKRLKLVNWHNFENVTFDCARLTYMMPWALKRAAAPCKALFTQNSAVKMPTAVRAIRWPISARNFTTA